MKQLIINPEFGLAGDMFSAALISAGADESRVCSVMKEAGKLLGDVEIRAEFEKRGTAEGIYIRITGRLNDQVIAVERAEQLLEDICRLKSIKGQYRDFALRALVVLANAEEKAHREIDAMHHHHSDHDHPHHDHDHHHDDHHHHSHEETEPFLHEAQDIVIDLAGAAYALQLLDIDTASVVCLEPVFTGGGTICFSHGEFSVPAPATKAIINEYRIPAGNGPVEKELLTPTGAAILAALAPVFVSRSDFFRHTDVNMLREGTGFGTMKVESADGKQNALHLFLADSE